VFPCFWDTGRIKSSVLFRALITIAARKCFVAHAVAVRIASTPALARRGGETVIARWIVEVVRCALVAGCSGVDVPAQTSARGRARAVPAAGLVIRTEIAGWVVMVIQITLIAVVSVEAALAHTLALRRAHAVIRTRRGGFAEFAGRVLVVVLVTLIAVGAHHTGLAHTHSVARTASAMVARHRRITISAIGIVVMTRFTLGARRACKSQIAGALTIGVAAPVTTAHVVRAICARRISVVIFATLLAAVAHVVVEAHTLSRGTAGAVPAARRARIAWCACWVTVVAICAHVAIVAAESLAHSQLGDDEDRPVSPPVLHVPCP